MNAALWRTVARSSRQACSAVSGLRHSHPSDRTFMVRRLCPQAPVHRTLLGQLDWNFVPLADKAPPVAPPQPTRSIVAEIVSTPDLFGFDPDVFHPLQLMPKREYNPHWRKRKSKHGFMRCGRAQTTARRARGRCAHHPPPRANRARAPYALATLQAPLHRRRPASAPAPPREGPETLVGLSTAGHVSGAVWRASLRRPTREFSERR
jgi:ribosomal protein L34